MIDPHDRDTMDLEDRLQGMHRQPDHETSIKAAGKVRRFTLREQVIDFARARGVTGFIDDDLKLFFDTPESSMRKRRTELAQENIIVQTASTRLNVRGSEERVWVHRDYHPSPPPVQERDTTPKQSRLARLEAQVSDLTDMVALALPYVEAAIEHGRAAIRRLADRMTAAASN